MKVEKSDYLFTIIGTNPFPNLIAALTRVKEKGEICCLYTKDEGNVSNTNKVLDDFKKVVLGKTKNLLSVTDLNIPKNNSTEIKRELYNKLNKIYKTIKDGGIIELNFTGGTKVMSSSAYLEFKDFALKKSENIKFVLTYTDGEKEKNYYECICKGEIYLKEEKLAELNTNYDLKAKDIIDLHSLELENEPKTEPYDWQLGKKLFDLFIEKENYEKGIEFLSAILNQIIIVEKEAKGKSKGYKKKQYILNSLKELEENPEKNIFNLKVNPLENVKSYEDLSYVDNEITWELVESLKGFWLEDYIFKLVLELKEEGLLLDAVNSVKTRKKNFELDFMMVKRFKAYCISVTMQETKDKAILKLFEVKERARQIAGDEAGICFINLYNNSEELESEIKNIWDIDTVKNVKVICTDRFYDVKNIIKEWIGGKSYGR